MTIASRSFRFYASTGISTKGVFGILKSREFQNPVGFISFCGRVILIRLPLLRVVRDALTLVVSR